MDRELRDYLNARFETVEAKLDGLRKEAASDRERLDRAEEDTRAISGRLWALALGVLVALVGAVVSVALAAAAESHNATGSPVRDVRER